MAINLPKFSFRSRQKIALQVQLNEIQKIMTSINGSNNAESTSRSRGSNDDSKDHSNHNFENSLATEVEPSGCERNSNLMYGHFKAKNFFLTLKIYF